MDLDTDNKYILLRRILSCVRNNSIQATKFNETKLLNNLQTINNDTLNMYKI